MRFCALKQRGGVPADLKLVLAGGKGWLFDGIFEHHAASPIHDDILLPGFVPDELLPAIYSAAEVLAFPSLYEGFGLPILEAMACGTPVVASRASCLPEVAEGAALVDRADRRRRPERGARTGAVRSDPARAAGRAGAASAPPSTPGAARPNGCSDVYRKVAAA